VLVGLLEWHDDQGGRRAETIVLTADGKKPASHVGEVLAGLRARLAEVSQADIEACLRVFRAIGDAGDDRPREPPEP
jgi:hypothetical protein